MTEIQDGHVVIVGSLIQTQIVLQRVLQLADKEKTQAVTNTHIHTKKQNRITALGVKSVIIYATTYMNNSL